ACLGAGIYLAGQIFNLEEHWPGGLMLWSLGAIIAWLILKQWPQALLAAILIPCWLGGEWDLATEAYRGAWNIAAQGFLLLSILYITTTPKDSNRDLRRGLIWTGALALIPSIGDVMGTANADYSRVWQWHPQAVPASMLALGYAGAYLPALAI